MRHVEEVIVTVAFGFLGYLMTRHRYPGACLVLGLVLGNLVEANFHRSLLIGQGSYWIFFNRPLSLTILILTVILLAWPYLKRLFAGKPARASTERAQVLPQDMRSRSED